jgi:hypothetical protein
MTTPLPSVNVVVLESSALDVAIASLERHPASSALWEHLRARGFSPQLTAATGARIAHLSLGRGYTYLSLPFVSAQGQTARLVWDDLMGDARAGYGLAVRAGGVLSQVDVHQVVNGVVGRTHRLVRRPDQNVEVVDSTGHTLETIPHRQAPQTGPVAEVTWDAATAGCGTCQTLVDLIFGVVACGGFFQYWYCDMFCTGLTAGQLVFCSIACGIFIGLICWVGGEVLKAAVCHPWCG